MTGIEKLCFVVGPIGAIGSEIRNHADLLLEFVIKPVMREFSEFNVVRQDEDTKPGMIDSQIINSLRDADLVIADLSHLNPNAFYEIGIRHMIAKPIVHMQLEDQRIPFDLSLYKTVPFSFLNPTTYQTAKDALEKQVREAIAPNYQVDNPVTRALGQQHFRQTASPEMKVIADQLESMTVRLSALESNGGGASLAGVVSHSVTLYVDVAGGDEEARSGAVAHAIVGIVPTATITRSAGDRLHVRFNSTKRGALRVMQRIDELPGVVNCSTPIFRVDQGDLF